MVEVDPAIVVAVLAQFGVDASTPAAIDSALESVRRRRAKNALPPTIVVQEGDAYVVGVQAQVVLEDGTRRQTEGELPDDLPLGWHRIITVDQDIALIVVPASLPEVPSAWGWMLQLYALRSSGSWGMGDFADLAEVARRAGAEQGAGVLLVNPVQAFSPSPHVERSPYSPSSRRFANPLYLRVVDTSAFAAAGLDVQEKVLALAPERDTELIDYDAVWGAKLAALELLWPFHRLPEVVDKSLDRFALFCALAEIHGPDWRSWPLGLRDSRGPAVTEARGDLADRVAFYVWLQVLCREQLDAARDAARHAGMSVGIVHDLPVGVHPGGADTWSDRELFGAAVRVGCPADAFNALGQDWDLPPWRPDKLAEAGYEPFRDVIRSVLHHADGIRVDHIAGLWRLWWIPPGEPAHRGTYVHYDADAMLGVLLLEAHRAGAVVVGEDLGTVEEIVTETMHQRGMLSSAVLWFERDWDAPGQPHIRPEDWEPETMASISTHDLPTVEGWLVGEQVRVQAELGLLAGSTADAEASAARDREALFALLHREDIPADDPLVALHAVIARAASRLVLSSPADAVGQLPQPNLPGTIDEYPNWRIPLPVDLDAFFDDARVKAAVAPLRAARPSESSKGR